ncbi:hypothetical protein XELAEV_18012699mg [Xenopus laevis]|uniref:Uncharacterized protein n=1 Tax=Xenopus laevis TaxID=8355 RepID=A0A974HYH9_XENLA|nr:hypothetical protein XELAEV_18012699mg [Xenopus laevis]
MIVHIEYTMLCVSKYKPILVTPHTRPPKANGASERLYLSSFFDVIKHRPRHENHVSAWFVLNIFFAYCFN